MMKLYGTEFSIMVNKVRFVAHYLDMPYEFARVNLFSGENRTEAYLKIHPAGKVPAIDDDGFCLFESNAIIRYLAEKKVSPIYPRDLKERALVDMWMDFVSLHVGTAMGRVFYNRVIAKFLESRVDENSLSEGLKFLEKFLPVIDQELGGNEFVAGDKITLADFNLLAQLDPAEISQVDLGPYSNIVIWRKKLMKEEFYVKCYASYTDLVMQMQQKK